MKQKPMELTQEQIQFIIDNHQEFGNKYCAEKLGIPKSVVMYWVSPRKLNLPKISKENRSKIIRIRGGFGMGLNYDLFLKDFSVESAYILGLLWADGSVNKQKILLTCAKEDCLDYMETFLKSGNWRFFDRETDRYGVKGKTSRTIYSGNCILAEELRSLGYMPNCKDSPDELLDRIPEHILHYWFRGLFDGDGCFQFHSNGISRMTITAPYDQNWSFMIRLAEKLKIVYVIKRDSYKNKHGKINSRSVFRITNAEGHRIFFNYIYEGVENDKIGLKRKLRKWNDYVCFAKTRPKIGIIFRSPIEQEEFEGKSSQKGVLF